MKKLVLFTSLLCLVVFSGYSQSLSLIYDGNAVPNNGQVVYTGEPSSALIVAYMGVTNNSASTLSVMCKKVEISLVTGSQNTFCWDNCYPPNVYVSMGFLDITPGETNSLFTGDYEPLTNAGQSIIRYVYYDANNPNDSVCFQALFNAYPLGVENQNGLASLSAAYPNPASTQASFNYSVEEGASAFLLVRNVLGSTVKEIQLKGSGVTSISTMDLSDGIYFYSMIVNGKVESTRKLVVSH
ncbi:MAG: T9SS type A sorting domain-containing protein [Bacteroidales bacterium]|nr:T9SS type A sorting domain-containing protein [Bacteroidales bacterium]